MKKTFNFGKIAYDESGRKDNLVTIEISFDDTRFSASGNVWNRLQTDIISGGQNLDELYEYLKDDGLFLKIYSIWKQYHLNDMTPGTPKQMATVIWHNGHFSIRGTDAVHALLRVASNATSATTARIDEQKKYHDLPQANGLSQSGYV